MNPWPLDWETPAGRTLRALCEVIEIPATITVFGSAPLQMMLDKSLRHPDPRGKSVSPSRSPQRGPHGFMEIPGMKSPTLERSGCLSLLSEDVDVRAEIIAPALELRRLGYGHDLPKEDHSKKLRALGRPPER